MKVLDFLTGLRRRGVGASPPPLGNPATIGTPGIGLGGGGGGLDTAQVRAEIRSEVPQWARDGTTTVPTGKLAGRPAYYLRLTLPDPNVNTRTASPVTRTLIASRQVDGGISSEVDFTTHYEGALDIVLRNAGIATVALLFTHQFGDQPAFTATRSLDVLIPDGGATVPLTAFGTRTRVPTGTYNTADGTTITVTDEDLAAPLTIGLLLRVTAPSEIDQMTLENGAVTFSQLGIGSTDGSFGAADTAGAFIDLSDVIPSSYAGAARKFPRVTDQANGLRFDLPEEIRLVRHMAFHSPEPDTVFGAVMLPPANVSDPINGGALLWPSSGGPTGGVRVPVIRVPTDFPANAQARVIVDHGHYWLTYPRPGESWTLIGQSNGEAGTELRYLSQSTGGQVLPVEIDTISQPLGGSWSMEVVLESDRHLIPVAAITPDVARMTSIEHWAMTSWEDGNPNVPAADNVIGEERIAAAMARLAQVQTWARTGDSAPLVPADRIVSAIARLNQVAPWARDGNDEQIPVGKIPDPDATAPVQHTFLMFRYASSKPAFPGASAITYNGSIAIASGWMTVQPPPSPSTTLWCAIGSANYSVNDAGVGSWTVQNVGAVVEAS